MVSIVEPDARPGSPTVADDPEKQRFVFSGVSMTQVTVHWDVGAWADWLREQFEHADAEAPPRKSPRGAQHGGAISTISTGLGVGAELGSGSDNGNNTAILQALRVP